jgi:hypothetical protein
MAVDVRFGGAGSTTYLGVRMLEEVSGAKFFNIPYARVTRAMQGFLTHDIKDGGACPPWRHGAFYFSQEKQRWRRKAVMCLRPTSATLKIFRSIRRRWTAPTWAGIRLLRDRLGLIQEGFAKRYGIPLSSIRQYEIARTMPPPVRAT